MHYTQRRLPAKPTIQKTHGGGWRCHDDLYIFGYGNTPYLAYLDWKIREQRRTRMPRAGIWNKKSCVRWFREGCWVMRSYIGRIKGPAMQIFGYDPSTDELILRG
jgi:hypothetical protein